MKQLMAALLITFLFTGPAFAQDTYVQGYTKSNGTYVQGYRKSSPNQYRHDNYSSDGNTNPYTGEEGDQKNEYSSPPVYNKSYNTNNNPYNNDPYNNNQYDDNSDGEE